MGINSLVDWIENECNTRVVETDIFTYPTKNTKELLAIDKQILNKSIEKFWQVLLEFQPDTIILYGSLTVDVLKKLLKDKNKKVEYFCENVDEIFDKNSFIIYKYLIGLTKNKELSKKLLQCNTIL